MSVGAIVGLAVVGLLLVAFIGFALRDDSDVDMDDVRDVGNRIRGDDDNERPPRRE